MNFTGKNKCYSILPTELGKNKVNKVIGYVYFLLLRLMV